MTFLEHIIARLERDADIAVAARDPRRPVRPGTGAELLALVFQARKFSRSLGLKQGDRCALIAPNSIRWVALDLAMMAEGLIVVPLYARQAPAELVAMMKDATPSAIFCSDESLSAEIRKRWPEAAEITLLDEVFAGPARHQVCSVSSRGFRPGDNHLHVGHVRANRKAWC